MAIWIGIWVHKLFQKYNNILSLGYFSIFENFDWLIENFLIKGGLVDKVSICGIKG